jgi:hypothetical protein
MAKPSELSDDVLLRRARHGGRSLTALAVICTLLAIVSLAVAIADPSSGIWPAAVSFLAIATGYWLLAIAARRGDERAITAFIGVYAILIALNIALQAWTFFRSDGRLTPQILWIVIPALILYALARNRVDLLELKRRGLADAAFPLGGSARGLWAPGAVLLATGTVGLLASLLLPAVSAAKQAKTRHDFTAMIQQEEYAFLELATTSTSKTEVETLDKLLQMLGSLESRAKAIAAEAPDEPRLQQVLADYVDIVQTWNRGFSQIREAGFADEATIEMLNDADQRRLRVFEAFDALRSHPANSK